MSKGLLKRVIAECSDEGSSSNITTALYCEISEYLEMPEPAEPVAWLSDRGTIWHDKMDAIDDSDGFVEPLYTTPPDQSAQIAELEKYAMENSISAYRDSNNRLTDQIEQLEQQLAALQAKRERLSDSKIIEIMGDRFPAETIAFYEGFRAAEKTHGIGINHE